MELARRDKCDFIFFSTNRVYPVENLNSLNYSETSTRFQWGYNQKISSASSKGITEDFPIDNVRSLYGATKLSSELIIQEYSIKYYS